MTLEVHDRLMHMGGLNGTLTTAQTVGSRLSNGVTADNMAERIGDADLRHSGGGWSGTPTPAQP